MKKICFVATIPAVIQAFLKGHANAAAAHWPVTLICHPSGRELLAGIDARFNPMAIERKIAPWRDLCALWQLYRHFKRERYALVHSIMPKTGLLAMMAAWAAGVPYRLHTFTGQVWANKRGFKRAALKMFDRLIVLFASHILTDSPSQRDFLVNEGVLRKGQGIVVGHGSICGVDGGVFKPDAALRAQMRAELDIGAAQPVILFVGRLNRDKGMLDLAKAFAALLRRHPETVLVLVGAEENVPFSHFEDVCGDLKTQLRRIAYTPNPERYMAMADIFCLPSYREGFGQVIVEAAAAGIPTVSTAIYGVTDAVEDGATGLLIKPGDVDALERALCMLIEQPEKRRQMGNAARERALKLFDSRQNTEALLSLYNDLLRQP